MTRLSVNINKIATLRNARGGANPDLIKSAIDCERFGAQGITVHPRPDERHITFQDVLDLKGAVTTEFNIEGYPDERYMDLVKKVRPEQATLVPDPPSVLTSNAGWDTIANRDFLSRTIEELNQLGIRTSIFVEPDISIIEGAKAVGTDRIELYTESFASEFRKGNKSGIDVYVAAAKKATELGIGLNAGHDLDLNNLRFLKESIPNLDEVSIGHALICDSLYLGLENTIQLYLRELN